MPGKDGLLHISEVRKLAGGKRVENVEDVLAVGQKIQVEITKIDDRGKLSLAPVVDEADAADTDGSAAAARAPRLPPKARSAAVPPDGRSRFARGRPSVVSATRSSRSAARAPARVRAA